MNHTDSTTMSTTLQLNDATSFTLLYNSHAKSLYNYGIKITSDEELLKDCIHDVFIKIYAKRNELSNVENIKSYLFISLKNRIFDEIRKSNCYDFTSLEEANVKSKDDVEHIFIKNEQQKNDSNFISLLLNKLSPRQREALTLYYINEKEYSEICQIMQMNYQSVRNLIHRSILKLRQLSQNEQYQYDGVLLN